MALDHRTMLGPRLRIQSAETLLTYLGAVPEQLADFDSSHRRWGQGTVQITLQPCRKNLLKIDYQRFDLKWANWTSVRKSSEGRAHEVQRI